MLALQRELIAKELTVGTGAAIAVQTFDMGRRQGLRIWFNDLDEKDGPVTELKPHGLLAYDIKLSLGIFCIAIRSQMAEATAEEIQLARSLVRSAASVTNLVITGQSLDDWTILDKRFEIIANYRHQELDPNSDAVIAAICKNVIVPLMAAMAELIGYDVIENSTDSNIPEIEGALSRATVAKRERNPRNRLLCLRIHGNICKSCGINPQVEYGSAGDIMEVHHLEPLSMLENPRPYNPETDLIPLCPNCHRVVHTRRPWPLSIEEIVSLREAARA